MSSFACSPIRGSEPGVGWNWAKQMSKHNNIWVVTRSSNRSEIENNIQVNNNVNFVYISIPFFTWIEKYTHKKIIHLYYYFWQKYILKKIKELNKDEKFDIIHHVTYNEFRNPGYLWKLNVPFILGPVGGAQEIEHELMGYCEGGYNKALEKVRSKINNYIKNSNLLSEAFKKSTKIVVANNNTSTFLELPPEKYSVMLETGINEKNCNYILRNNNTKVKLLWIGNLIYIKGLRLLIDSFNNLPDKEKYEVIIIGDGKLNMKYQKLINEKGLSKYFTFMGKLSYKDTLSEYKNADIFLFTSLRDTSGNVVLEAMSNCLPIISLDHHGAADILTEDCAIKIKIENKEQVINDITHSIIELGNDHGKRIKMGINAYKRIHAVYLWDKKGDEMQKIYNNIFSNRKL
jgi:glycosyltransferase involved in cell wall biosynthesis